MSEQRELYIGLMSGTSLDGIDAVVMDFSVKPARLVHQHHQAFPEQLHHTLSELIAENTAPHESRSLPVGRALANAYIDTVRQLLSGKESLAADTIIAIGNHGQTVFHAPPLSVQLDDGQYMADQLGIPVVNQFRQADLAAGGEGAPLVPAFHRHMFGAKDTDIAVLNIGGIANLTLLMADGSTRGFDTGPGNTLMDLWIAKHQGLSCDVDGRWASEGVVDKGLLQHMLQEPWLKKAPPKSTGRELFNLSWLENHLTEHHVTTAARDVQATLCELTAVTIAEALHTHGPGVATLIVCGGGFHNSQLLQRLKMLLPQVNIASSETKGIHPDWVEACAFAWLAMAKHADIPGNIPAVTGAAQECVLGTVHTPGP